MLGVHSVTTMREYFHKDFDNYSPLFREHAIYFAELMKVLDDEFIGMGHPPAARTRELFRMTQELIYMVDNAYEQKFTPERESNFRFTSFVSQDEILSGVRTMLKEELAHYLGSTDGAQ